MKKIYADEENSKVVKEEIKNDSKDNNKLDNKDTSDAGGASGFSDDAEKKFQQKKKGKMEKLHNVVSKGLIPPQGNQAAGKGKWTDLKVRVKWSLLMASLFFLLWLL